MCEVIIKLAGQTISRYESLSIKDPIFLNISFDESDLEHLKDQSLSVIFDCKQLDSVSIPETLIPPQNKYSYSFNIDIYEALGILFTLFVCIAATLFSEQISSVVKAKVKRVKRLCSSRGISEVTKHVVSIASERLNFNISGKSKSSNSMEESRSISEHDSSNNLNSFSTLYNNQTYYSSSSCSGSSNSSRSVSNRNSIESTSSSSSSSSNYSSNNANCNNSNNNSSSISNILSGPVEGSNDEVMESIRDAKGLLASEEIAKTIPGEQKNLQKY